MIYLVRAYPARTKAVVRKDTKRFLAFFKKDDQYYRFEKKKKTMQITLNSKIQIFPDEESKEILLNTKAIAQRENRWINDMNHCISKTLVEAYPKGTMFVIEDLTENKQEIPHLLNERRE